MESNLPGLAFVSVLAHASRMRAPLFVALLFVLLPVIALADSDEPSLMAQAQRAFIAGDYDTAKQIFGEVIELDPHNTVAIQYLRNIRLAQAGALPTPKDTLHGLILPRVELKAATFSAALDFFKREAAAQSVTVSFVPQLPAAQMDRSVTLSLSQIPFLDALKYLCQLDDATYKVERYAIVILPAAPADTPAPTPATQ